jgi:hypothetical protein
MEEPLSLGIYLSVAHCCCLLELLLLLLLLLDVCLISDWLLDYRKKKEDWCSSQVIC